MSTCALQAQKCFLHRNNEAFLLPVTHGGGRLGPGLVVGPRTAASAQVPTPCLLRLMLQVMDEADRLLEQGCTDFTVDLEVILAAVPARRQTLLFSATLTDTLRELQGLATNQPFFWEAQAP